MTRYEDLIMSCLEGETPKEKYNSLNAILYKMENLRTLFKGLKETPDDAILANLRSFIDAYAKSVGVN